MMFKNKMERVLHMEKDEKQNWRDELLASLEKNDVIAMALAALMVFMPAVLAVAGIFAAIMGLFFLRG